MSTISNVLSTLGNDALAYLPGTAQNTAKSGNYNITPVKTATPAATTIPTPAPSPYAEVATDPTTEANKQATLYGIDTSLAGANDAMGRLGNQQAIGEGNIDRDYQSAYQKLIGQQAKAKADYDQSTVDQLNDYTGARNGVSASTRSWLDNARRTLGAAGAGGGSAARYGITDEAQGMAAAGNSNAQATNNKNIIALNRNWGDTTDQFTNAGNDLVRQRDQGKNDFESTIASKKADLLNTIGTLMGQKTLANGGNWQAASAAATPYTSRVAGILDSIDSLSATPAITAPQVTVGTPTLAGYDFAKPTVAATPQQDASLTTPLVYSSLFGDPNDQQQLVPA